MQQTKPLSAMSQDFQEWVFKAWINRDESLQVLFLNHWTSVLEDEKLDRNRVYRKKPSNFPWSEVSEDYANYLVLLAPNLIALFSSEPDVGDGSIRVEDAGLVEIAVYNKTELDMQPFKVYKRGE